MKRTKPPSLLLINVLSLALAIACSGSMSTPLGPTGSETNNSSSGNTTIRGHASGTARTSSVRSLAASSSSAVKVCVSGTSNCDELDADGQFEIHGNLSGNVPLSFSGSQGNANVTVPNVHAGETIVVVVQLLGAASTVRVESRSGDTNGNGNGNGNGNVADDDSDDADDESDDDSEDDDSDDDSEDDDSEDDDSDDDDDSKDDKSGPSGSSGSGNHGRH